jgi:arylsulfatase
MKPLLHLIITAVIMSPAALFSQEMDRSSLPIPNPEFKGRIGKTFEDSKQDYAHPVAPPKGAPNVVLILLDDVGFGQPGTFGGPVPTPELDKLARQGIAYNRFHTTGICSPTRAALLTGRNHHQVGFGTITELSTGYPGYHSVWADDCASVARVLTGNGYSSAAFGKWHNTPDWETNPMGPFKHWPTGLGFEYFYGFQGGETSQWHPQLFRNTTPVEPPKTPEQGYHLTEDLVDEAIGWMNRQQSISPDKPFFVYFAPGATHAPLHAPKDYIDKFKGQFDQGWDKVREETFARQKKLGAVPESTKLTPRPPEIQAWDSLDADAKRLYARHQEVFAGFLNHTDHELGRLLDAVRALPGADNTMVIFIAGDNGPSAEGSLTGTINNMMTQNGLPDSVEAQIREIAEIGGTKHENHYPVGWAWAGAAPFQWMKRVPSHFGGTRNGMVISWPAKIKHDGKVRSQFHHVVDIAPTIYEAAGIPAPKSVNGVGQAAMAGISMSYTFGDPAAADRRKTQYFETGGHRAIYHEGWVAAAFHGAPWVLTGSVGFTDPKANTWALYKIDEDFSQAVDLAAQNPAKVKELQAIFDQEAKKYSVYPLDDRFAERATNPERPSVTRDRDTFTYTAGTVRIPEGSAPPIYQRSHTITADVEVKADTEGVIVAEGGTVGGYVLRVQDGKLIYEYNFFGKERTKIETADKLPAGKVTVAMEYVQTPPDKSDPARGGKVTLKINGKAAGSGEVKHVVPARFSATETLDVGSDLGSTVSESYKAPNAFTGEIGKVLIKLK